MFARISRRYDLLNTVMTAGRHHAWRDIAAGMAADRLMGPALDVATGTGDFALALSCHSSVSTVVGLDYTQEMIALAANKAQRKGMDQRLNFVVGDAHSLPFADGQFICATVGFGMRNFIDSAKALQEIRSEPEFEALTITYKRIKNILDDQEIDELRVGEVHLVERAEKDLFQEFLVLDHDITQQLDSGNYLKALNLMASLRGKVDRFFEEVMVLTENCELRRNRLRLLSGISRMFLQVADISMIRQIKVGD